MHALNPKSLWISFLDKLAGAPQPPLSVLPLAIKSSVQMALTMSISCRARPCVMGASSLRSASLSKTVRPMARSALRVSAIGKKDLVDKVHQETGLPWNDCNAIVSIRDMFSCQFRMKRLCSSNVYAVSRRLPRLRVAEDTTWQQQATRAFWTPKARVWLRARWWIEAMAVSYSLDRFALFGILSLAVDLYMYLGNFPGCVCIVFNQAVQVYVEAPPALQIQPSVAFWIWQKIASVKPMSAREYLASILAFARTFDPFVGGCAPNRGALRLRNSFSNT